MTQFDQRHQQVGTQYNAGRDINVYPPPLSLTETQRNRNRSGMLKRVQTIWIRGVLEPSLHGAAQIALELQKQPGAVVTPWWLVLQEFEQSEALVPADASIGQVYDQAGGELLILGEPGAGKTTLLLELARDLLDRAHQDESHPMPVVFNLSSWATMRQPLADWLVTELDTKYQIPRALAASWIATDQVLPLLDGLDEVAAPDRGACVKAINAYRQAHGLLPTVVCTRRADYLALPLRLLLRTAVMVQPLTHKQIEAYLAYGGEQLAALHRALQEDADLYTLASTPLMLDVLTTAYQGTARQEIAATGSLETKQEQVFAAYVQRVLTRRTASSLYTQEQTRHWLSFLAQQMKQQNQAIFYIEHMQPDWLSDDWMRRAYDRWAIVFPAILMGILASLGISSLLYPFILSHSSSYSLDFPLFLALNSVLGGFLGWLLAGRTPLQPRKHSRMARGGTWSRLFKRLRTGVLIAFGAGLSVGLRIGQPFGLRVGLSVGLSVGLASILLQALLEKSSPASSLQAPRLSWKRRWQPLMKSNGVRNGTLVGLSYGLSYGLSFSLSFSLPIFLHLGVRLSAILRLMLLYTLTNGLDKGLIEGLILGLSGGLLSALLTGKPVGISLADELIWSWRSLGRSLLTKRHIYATLRVTALIGLGSALSTALSYYGSGVGVGVALIYGLLLALPVMLGVGLSFWLLFGLFQGVSSETIGDQHRVVPNQGIRQSARNCLVSGLISTGIVWLTSGLGAGLIATGGIGLRTGLSVELSIGLSAGLLAGLLNGGLVCLRHSVVRLLLWRVGSIPWNYPRFLDFVAERILLRKVGGGYIFLHQLLLDYFAAPIDIR